MRYETSAESGATTLDSLLFIHAAATHIMTFSKGQIEAIAARQGNPETVTIEH